ncbi:GtrA family protein [Nocardioides sp. CFH 31398]|uniref:GtrA family protein n=1 Tax=Nocardioides sp. CFH 31398 TaxID=2919579 RepID=UPI001F051B51|nr:GtrA family protein [Nocardioides sp. CFH 31398]MCH1866410.1 GtrA family protein [Nocardioides sp. CFH 31398]
MGTWRRRGTEGVKFAGVGTISTVVSFVLFNVLLHGVWIFDDPWLADMPITAYVVANTVGMVLTYVGSRTWAFRNRETHGSGGVVSFVVINVTTMAIPVALLWVSRNLLGLTDPISDNIAANVVGLALGFVARFYLFRKFVFTKPERPGRTGPAGESTGRASAGRAPAAAPAAGEG